MLQKATLSKWRICVVSLLLLTLFLVLSCGTSAMMLTVKRPAEVNLKGYSKIAVGDIADPNGRISQHSRDISEVLTSTLFDTKRFEVLDR